jgi:hypothetical protein
MGFVKEKVGEATKTSPQKAFNDENGRHLPAIHHHRGLQRTGEHLVAVNANDARSGIDVEVDVTAVVRPLIGGMAVGQAVEQKANQRVVVGLVVVALQNLDLHHRHLATFSPNGLKYETKDEDVNILFGEFAEIHLIRE